MIKPNKGPQVVTVGTTTKGHRVWLQTTQAHYGFVGGTTMYNVEYNSDTIVLTVSPQGKRKVTDSKGGIIDLVGKKVSQWAQGATTATVTCITGTTITITRGTAQ